MNIITILRKLGILRFGGTKATYTSAKDRPTSFMMDGVYNDEKDLVTKQDIKNVVETITGKTTASKDACPKCGAALQPDVKFCSGCGAPCGRV